MKLLTEKKYIKLLVVLCAAVYFVSYITRINYAAVLVELTRDLGISKAAASMALTGSAISYGLGQLLSGYLGDKIKASKIILGGLLCTTAMNLVLPISSSPVVMTVIWIINGLAQAMMWPPIVKIMSSMLTEIEYKKGCIKVSQASSVATILIYLISPVIIHIFGWRYVFIFAAVMGITMCIIWKLGFRIAEANLREVEAEHSYVVVYDNDKYERFTPQVFVILGVVMFTIVVQGALRDGVANWMPTYISETFNLGSEISILTNVALPIVSIAFFQWASALNRRFIKNEFICTGLTYALMAATALTLSAFGNRNVVLAIVMAALLNGATHGVNYYQTCLVPIYFAKYGKVSFISGLLNSCTYIGSSVSTYGIAVLTENFTWSQIALSWAGMSVLGGIICFLMVGAWKKFKNGKIS